MQAPHSNTLHAAEAMDSFIDRNAETLPLAAAAGGRGRLKTSIGQLNGLSNAQDAALLSARGLTARLKAERTALIEEHMDPIRRIAIADLPHTPDVKALGAFDAGAGLATLLQRAHGMAQAAAPFAAVFEDGGLPSTFIADLTTAANTVNATFNARKAAEDRSAAATRQIKTVAVAARRTMAALNTLVRKDLKGNATLLHEWNSARKIRKVAVSAAAPAVVPAAPAPAPAPAPAAQTATPGAQAA